MYNDFDTLNYSTTYTLLVNARGSEIKPFISEQPCICKSILDRDIFGPNTNVEHFKRFFNGTSSKPNIYFSFGLF